MQSHSPQYHGAQSPQQAVAPLESDLQAKPPRTSFVREEKDFGFDGHCGGHRHIEFIISKPRGQWLISAIPEMGHRVEAFLSGNLNVSDQVESILAARTQVVALQPADLSTAPTHQITPPACCMPQSSIQRPHCAPTDLRHASA